MKENDKAIIISFFQRVGPLIKQVRKQLDEDYEIEKRNNPILIEVFGFPFYIIDETHRLTKVALGLNPNSYYSDIDLLAFGISDELYKSTLKRVREDYFKENPDAELVKPYLIKRLLAGLKNDFEQEEFFLEQAKSAVNRFYQRYLPKFLNLK